MTSVLASILLVLALAGPCLAQSAFPIPVEADFVAKDVRFDNGERATEIRLHIEPSGTPGRMPMAWFGTRS